MFTNDRSPLDVAMQRSSNADELKELIERGSGLNQSYGGSTKPVVKPQNHTSPYAQGRSIGERPPVIAETRIVQRS